MSFQDPANQPPIAQQQQNSRTAGGMPQNPWRQKMQRASFRGAQFYTDVDGKASGRRVALHEFPKKDTPLAEDMGRKARKHFVVGYVIANQDNGFDYTQPRDRLVQALEQEGPGQLIHPTLGSEKVLCESYSTTEDQRRGGVCMFEMGFVEYGSAQGTGADAATDDTQQGASSAASDSEQAASNNLDSNWSGGTPLPGGAPIGQGGIGHA